MDRLASIVEDLLQISQYESGKLVLDIERFDIHQLTQDIFDALSYQAKSKQITLSFKGESNTPFFVEADKVRISQVLNNLISNAIKYGREKGNVFVGFSETENTVLTEIAGMTEMGIAPTPFLACLSDFIESTKLVHEKKEEPAWVFLL